jgi:hypothetical protein
LFQVTDPPVDARVDSLSSTTAGSKRTYVILPGNPDVQPLDLQFQEFKLQTERVLQYRGFIAAPDPETAELIIFLAYGLGTPSVSYDYLSPPPPPTEAPPPPPPAAAPASQPLAQPIAYSEPSAPPAPPPATTHQPPAASSAAQGSSSALPPHSRHIRYLRYLSLSAIDLAYFNATGELAEVWRTNVSSIGKSDDLRRIVPVMLAAATKRIATGTNGRIEVRVTERHPKARYIRGEITEQALRRLESPYGP